MCVVPMPEAGVGEIREILLAVVQQAGNVLAVVVAGVVQTGDGGSGNGGTRTATVDVVLHAAVDRLEQQRSAAYTRLHVLRAA